MLKRFCTYCRLSKDAATCVQVRDKKGRLRTYRCADCDALRNKPAVERQAVAERRRVDKQDAEKRRMEEVAQAREHGRRFRKEGL